MIIFFIISFIAIISLIFTLNKQSKVRKFLSVFIYIVISMFILFFSIVIYMYYIEDVKEKENYESSIIEKRILNENKKKLAIQLENDKKIALPHINFNFNFSSLNMSPSIINNQQPIQIVGRIINDSKLNLNNFVIGVVIEDCNEDKCLIVYQNTKTYNQQLISNQGKDILFNIGNTENIVIYGKLKVSAGVIDINLNDHSLAVYINKECEVKALCVTLPE